MTEENKNRYVRWQVFIWAISILAIAIGWSFVAQAQLAAKVNDDATQFLDIKTKLSGITTDLQWIKQALRDSHATRK